MDKKVLTRIFKFEKDDKPVTLPDPNPAFSVEQVMQFYSHQYPELTTATISAPKTEGNTAVYAVETTIGTHA